MEVDDSAWTSRCGSGTGNSSTGAASHESCPPRLLAGASAVEAHRLCGGGRGGWAGHGEEAARWRRVRQTGPDEKCDAEEAARDGARRRRGRVGWADGHCDTRRGGGTAAREAEWGWADGHSDAGRK